MEFLGRFLSRSFAFALVCAVQIVALGIDPAEYAVQLTVQPQPSPPSLLLKWTPSSAALSYKVYRKMAWDGSWGTPLATLPANAAQFQDNSVQSGLAYEYQVLRSTAWGNASGYAYAGLDVPSPDYRGGVLLLVDQSIAGALGTELAQFSQDLIGDGWEVFRRDVSRSSTPPNVKSVILDAVNGAGGSIQALIIIGHVPPPYSGDINPDMHADHKGAWPADTYYATLDSNWPDTSVSNSTSVNPANHNVPGDGKFDPSTLPSPAALIVGRIDFANLPSVGDEVALLRRYFQKNHAYRHRRWAPTQRGLLYDGFGDIAGDAPAADAWRTLPPLFGAGQFDIIGPGQFFGVTSANSYAMAFASGGGAFTQMNGFGAAANFASSDPQTPFLFLNGSYFGDWNTTDNLLRAAIASPTYTLVSGWAGLPHWYLHFMGLGEIVGYGFRASQNNAGLYHSHQNPGALQVHTALFGDPTLRLKTVAPPTSVSAQETSDALRISWGASSDAEGYHVYSAQSVSGPFARITPSLINGATLDVPLDSAGPWIMVRSVKKESGASGTYFNASQGTFTETTTGPGPLPVISYQQATAVASESGPTAALITIQRSGPTTNPLEVLYSVEGSAANGVDFLQLPGRITIGAGFSTATIAIEPVADSQIEGDETARIELASTADYLLGAPSVVNITIHDPANQAPVITAIPAQSLSEDSPASVIAQFADADTAAESLVASVISENPNLITAALEGAGLQRTIRLTPRANQHGSTFIRFDVTDGVLSDSERFEVTVAAVNDPPALSPIQTMVLQENSPTSTVILTVTDPDSPLPNLTIQASSDNNQLFPSASLATVYSDGGWLLRLAPAPDRSGVATIMITASDGSAIVSQSFAVTVEPTFKPPLISAIVNQTLSEDQLPVRLPLDIVDLDTPSQALELSAFSSNPLLARIQPLWDGTEWGLELTPAVNANGVTTITVRASDGVRVAEQSFIIEIAPIPDAPELGVVSDIMLPEDANTHLVTIPATDVDTPIASLSVSATSDNPALFVASSLTPQFSGGEWRIPLQLQPDGFGQAKITYTVTDGETPLVQKSFRVTVTPSDDPPSIAALQDQELLENEALRVLPLFIADPDSNIATLRVSVSAINPSLFQRLEATWNGNNWQLLFQPARGASGITSLSVSVSDTESTIHTDFEVRIIDVAAPPQIASVAPVTFAEDTTWTINLSVADADTQLEQLSVSAISDNSSLFPASSISTVHSPGGWNVRLTPSANRHGSATISVRVSDGSAEASTAIIITVLSQPDPPSIAPLPSVTMPEDSEAIAVPLILADADTPVESLTVRVVSSNGQLLSEAAPTFVGNAWSLRIKPAADAHGAGDVTVYASDGDTEVFKTFRLIVTSIPDPPQFSPIAARAVLEDSGTHSFNIAVADSDTPFAQLELSAQVLPTNLVSSLIVERSADNWRASFSAAPNAHGTGHLRFIASDGSAHVTNDVPLEIVSVNDAPIITVLTNSPGRAGESLSVAVELSDIDSPQNELALLAAGSPSQIASVSPTRSQSGKWLLLVAPTAGFVGQAQLHLTASDGEVTVEQELAVTFLANNSAPIARDDNFRTHVDVPLMIPVTDLLKNDSDPDHGLLSVTAVEAISQNGGAVRMNGLDVIYTPATGFRGLFGFRYSIEDPSGASGSAMAFVNVISRPTVQLSIVGETLSVQVTGTAGESYILQSSDDFATWENNVTLEIDAAGTVSWTGEASAPRKFFRLLDPALQ